MVQLRPYQARLLRRLRRALETDAKSRVMMQLPTGGGKTVIAGALLSEWLNDGRKAVWLTHRKELVQQTHDMLQAAGVRSTIDMRWRPTDAAPSRPGGVVVLMAQTVGRRTSKLSAKTWTRYGTPDLMIIDEAHHAPANGYVRAMEQWPGIVLGMTATPWRLSEKEGFEHLFSNLVRGPQIVELQSEGALCKSRVLVPSSEQRIVGGQPGQTGDYTEAGITRANEGRPRVMTAEAVKIWQEHAADRQTIAYAVSQQHAHNLQAFFLDNGVEAEVILSDTDREQRRATIAGFKQGYVRVLINVLVAAEGFDLPDASCVMMARPTLSLSLYLQMVGRGLRPKPDGGDCLLLDLAGNTLTHGLPEARRRWSLVPRGKQAPAGLPPDDAVGELGGKSCGRCGRLRGWKHWEYEIHCGDAHDLVCDLCHIDAHLAAHLPAPASPLPAEDTADHPEPIAPPRADVAPSPGLKTDAVDEESEAPPQALIALGKIKHRRPLEEALAGAQAAPLSDLLQNDLYFNERLRVEAIRAGRTVFDGAIHAAVFDDDTLLIYAPNKGGIPVGFLLPNVAISTIDRVRTHVRSQGSVIGTDPRDENADNVPDGTLAPIDDVNQPTGSRIIEIVREEREHIEGVLSNVESRENLSDNDRQALATARADLSKIVVPSDADVSDEAGRAAFSTAYIELLRGMRRNLLPRPGDRVSIDAPMAILSNALTGAIARTNRVLRRTAAEPPPVVPTAVTDILDRMRMENERRAERRRFQ